MTTQPRLLGTAFEQLEDRALPSSFGTPWADPGHMTLSFAADGTAAPIGPSSLFSTMSATGTTPIWQREILRAFQTWAVNANINIGVVADGGQAFGTSGAVQGDARFGDVRIGAAPISSTEAAFASPFSWTGSTFAGDVMFSSAQKFATGSQTSGYDVFSVAAHEAGHAFGLDHSTAAGSVMNESYGYRTGLSACDIANLQALYGPRTADSFEGTTGNNTRATASSLVQDKITGSRFTADADLTTTGDVDFYKFKAASTDATVSLQTKGLSLLQARVSVYDSAGKLVASGAAADLLNNDVTLNLTGLNKNDTYSVKVESATADVFGVGGYRISVDTDKNHKPKPLTPPPITDAHTNDTQAQATNLVGNVPLELDNRFDLTYRGAIEDTTDTDFYKVRAPKSANGGAVNLNVMVWSTDGALSPRVQVLDATGKEAAFRVLTNDAGLMSIVVENVSGNGTYYIKVSAQTHGSGHDTGGYFLGADFNEFASAQAPEIASNTLSTSAQTNTTALNVGESGIYQFVLSAEALTAGAAGVTLTATDAAGKVAFVLDASSGQSAVTVSQYLAAGTYTLKYAYHTASGQLAASIRYHVGMLALSEGVGTYPPTTSTPPSTTTTTTDLAPASTTIAPALTDALTTTLSEPATLTAPDLVDPPSLFAAPWLTLSLWYFF